MVLELIDIENRSLLLRCSCPFLETSQDLRLKNMEIQMIKQRRTEAMSMVSKAGQANEVEIGDSFTSLPKETLKTIFSFLPMKFACRTCFSSKKLLHLLKSIPRLHFGNKGGELTYDEMRRAPVETIERFLELRDAPIKSFTLQLDLNKVTFDVNHWISLLMQIGVEKLEIEIDGIFELPSNVFNSETIRSLTLWRCIFRPPSRFFGLGLVETMFLGEISLADDILSVLLSKCVYLRTLTLLRCNGFKKIEILQPDSRLECLKLEYCLTPITVNAPNLQTLHYYCETLNLHLKGSLDVMDVVYHRHQLKDYPICDYPGEGLNLKKNVLHNLAHVRSLSLTGWAIKSMSIGRVPKIMGLMYWGLGKLTLQMNLYDHRELKVLSCWLRSCPNLNKLTIRIYDNYKVTDEDIDMYPTPENLRKACMRSMQRNPEEYECFNTLEFIHMSGFSLNGYHEQAEFIKFFLANTKQLKKMVLFNTKMQPDRQEVLKMPRASKDAIIKVSHFYIPDLPKSDL